MMNRISETWRGTVWRLALAVLVLSVSGVATSAMATAASEQALPWEDARRFAEALETIRQNYAEPVDDGTLINEAISGMTAGLDPWSMYLDPMEYEQARIDALGHYEGIGVEVSRAEDGGYIIVAPFDGGPAERAGLRAGDRLLRASGVWLERVDPVELDALLHGEIGTAVTLTVQRGDAEAFEVTLTRELVNIPSASGRELKDGMIYIRIALFSDQSAAEVALLLNELRAAAHANGLVLDLRDNAGGLIDGAVGVADAFLDGGLVVSTRGRAEGQSFDYLAQPGDITAGLPIVVLVNAGTASAAEILAGALQDHGRAVLLGSTTFGKGAVQSLLPLEGGGAIKLTTAYYSTPAGRRIHDAGIIPDIEIAAESSAPIDDPDKDTLVGRAMELLESARRGKKAQP